LQKLTWKILEPEYREKTGRALKEMRIGNVKRFKNAEDKIVDLESGLGPAFETDSMASEFLICRRT